MKTNYGEEYNRESMYETAREHLLDGNVLKVNGHKCKSLIEVMLEDFKLEVDKEHSLLEQAQVEWDNHNEEGFFSKFSQAIRRSKTTDYLQRRLEKAFEDLKTSKDNGKEFISKEILKKKPSELNIQELNELLMGLKQYKQRLIKYHINGDLVNSVASKTLNITNKYIAEVESEISKRQSYSK